jgi:hypothetical protein
MGTRITPLVFLSNGKGALLAFQEQNLPPGFET